MSTTSTGLSADKYLLMRPVMAVVCLGEYRDSAYAPARAIVDILDIAPANHLFVTVKIGSQVMEMLRGDLLEKAVPLLHQ